MDEINELRKDADYIRNYISDMLNDCPFGDKLSSYLDTFDELLTQMDEMDKRMDETEKLLKLKGIFL